MKWTTCLQMVLMITAAALAHASDATPVETNPFFAPWTTPHTTPPFDQIKNHHFMPAYLKGMEEQKVEIEAIIANPQTADFHNTIAAFDRSGDLLARVGAVFNSLNSAHTNDEIQKIAREVTPLLTKHRNDIRLDDRLFQRVKSVYERRADLKLDTEEAKLLEDTYLSFVRSGADLTDEKKARFREISERLSLLSLTFRENLLKETNQFKLVIEKEAALAGLPPTVIAAAAETAAQTGDAGKWVFTIKKPSMIPFLQYARNRELREKLYRAYFMNGDNDNAFDNKNIVAEIAALRVERAQLQGYQSYADFALERNMAKTPQNVYDFLGKLWEPALANAKLERGEMQKIIDREGGHFQLQPWDWWYYAEKVRKEKYDLDENELRPYFLLDNVRQGAFDLAGKLYGIQIVERHDIPVYCDEVNVFEVKEADGTHIGLLYTDYFPRPGKRSGAWCGGFRGQERRDGVMITPLVTNVGNFSKPTGDTPSLLSPDEVETLFHEFGHALHALFSNTTYRGLSLPGDFIELPSQVMENWVYEPEVLKSFARHYQTGEVIPQPLVEKIIASSKFNQGFITVEYLAACYLDMDWHILTDTALQETNTFETQSMERIGLIPEIIPRYRSTYFGHTFSGGYSAGYYYYIWAEVLDSDAFQAFKEKGLFDRETARAFRENVLARSSADDAMKMYIQFRGKEPEIEPLLRKRGLK